MPSGQTEWLESSVLSAKDNEAAVNMSLGDGCMLRHSIRSETVNALLDGSMHCSEEHMNACDAETSIESERLHMAKRASEELCTATGCEGPGGYGPLEGSLVGNCCESKDPLRNGDRPAVATVGFELIVSVRESG